ncbi:hypothetical protein, partial [Amycolatopsis sacchari]
EVAGPAVVTAGVSVVMLALGACTLAGVLPMPRLAMLVAASAGLVVYVGQALVRASRRVDRVLREELGRDDE